MFFPRINEFFRLAASLRQLALTNETKMNRLDNEVEHGRYLAKRPDVYWGWAGKVGRTRLKRRAKMLSDGLLGNVLEVGCGSGLFTVEFTKQEYHLTAIDLSPDLLQLAKQAVPDKKM